MVLAPQMDEICKSNHLMIFSETTTSLDAPSDPRILAISLAEKNKVWGTNDYGICAFNENGEQKLDLPDFVRSSTGYMAQGDGVLVIAGMYGASMYDGKEWSSLVDLVDLYKKYGRES